MKYGTRHLTAGDEMPAVKRSKRRKLRPPIPSLPEPPAHRPIEPAARRKAKRKRLT